MPKCPHCHNKMEEWSEPSIITGKEFLSGFLILSIIITLTYGVICGAVDGFRGSPVTKCGKWFEKRWHYVVPTYQASCRTIQWLRNNKDELER